MGSGCNFTKDPLCMQTQFFFVYLEERPVCSSEGLFCEGFDHSEQRSEDQPDSYDGNLTPKFRATPAEGHLAPNSTFNMSQARMQGGSSSESGLKPVILLSRS
ncbi:hypothetical protein AVEN_265973-1 [Araneus ventricosus]|uniref:Uncharacterized protein n=1 Tax=Araneus ventricosus TaxID=182803 RepID=A0A4Y2GJQ0_ARAVE|nr:hypothetical protein AVEN_265973-1 [Araneus ventricosus]